MLDAGRILTSRPFWAVRSATFVISILIIWRGIIMTAETILYTPTDFLPYLFVIGLLAAIPIFIRSRKEYNDLNKAKLRDGSIAERMSYGMDYMAANVGIVIVSVVVAILGPGLVCEALGIEPSLAMCLLTALLTTYVIAVKRAHTLTDAVDVFRDVAKLDKLEGKKPAQPAEAVSRKEE